ncbi:MAG: FliM/FliN family flagellar motor switch protein [Gluconacetobacter diazotrophicus]|nr:FliM/FliN family flagellar motor switch protein [Gluconacetobacter diazotrophicus]
MSAAPVAVPASPLPLALRRLSRAEVDRLNRLNRWRAPLPLPGNESFFLHLLDADAPSPPRDERLQLRFSVGGDRFAADLPRPLMLDLIQSLDDRLRLDPLPPPDLAALLLESALLPLADALDRGTGRPVVLETLSPAARNPSPDAATDLLADGPWDRRTILLSGPGLQQLLALEGTSDGLEHVLAGWRGGRRPLHGLPMPVRLRYGSTVLTLGLLRSLRIGDAVLLQRNHAAPARDGSASAAVLAVADSLGATVRRAGSGWRLETPLRPLGWTDQDLSENGTAADGEHPRKGPDTRTTPDADLDELPVRLRFEAGQLELGLGVLRGLGVGSVLEFPGEPGRVAILSGTRRIGTGTLVSIDGRAGVRIDGFSDGLDAGGGA